MSITVLRQLLMKEAVKKSAGSSGIMTINKNITKEVDQLLQKYVNDALAQGVDIETLSPDQLKMIVAMNQPKPPKVFSGQEAMDQLNKLFPKKGEVVDMTGKNIDTSQGIMGGKSVKELMESGQVQKGTDDIKISDKITEREMFKNSNLNKKDSVTETISYIKTLKPMDAMKEANSVIGRKGKYKNLTPEESKKILQDTEDHIFERDIPIDPEDLADGGRIGFSGGRGILSILKNLFKVKQSGNDVKEFLSKRKFMKDIIGNTEKNKKARDLQMLKEAAEEAREEGGFKFKDVDIDKDIRPIFDKDLVESLKKNRKLNATGGRAGYGLGSFVQRKENSNQNQNMPAVDARMNLDYNTLVDQNTAQRATQRNMRGMNKNGFQTQTQTFPTAANLNKSAMDLIPGLEQHIENLQDIKTTTSGPEYFQKSTSDMIQNFSDAYGKAPIIGPLNQALIETTAPVLSAVTSLPYDFYEATQRMEPGSGVKGLYDAYMAEQPLIAAKNRFIGAAEPLANRITNVGTSIGDRISEIIKQQKAAGVPDEGLITNFKPTEAAETTSKPITSADYPEGYKGSMLTATKPTMADVAGPSNLDNFRDALYAANQFDKETGDRLFGGQLERMQSEYLNSPNDYFFAGDDTQSMYDRFNKIYSPSQTLSSGGRAGLYTGGMVDVEPNLSDIGHGSDALMARTRLVAPDSQATTSTGLNYLLAEDNDNIRVPFAGGGMSKRAFLKLLATLGGGAAAFKTGILGLGEGTTKKAITETVKQAAGSGGQVPPYFLNLVKKIKTLGDDTLATQDKAIAKKYKDYTMEEDFAGNIEIIKKGDDVAEDVFMSYKVDDVPLKGKKGSTKVEEYEEYTARPDAEGKMKDVEQGVPDEVVQEGTVFEDTLSEFGKADGGRIGFSAGGLQTMLGE